MSFLSFFKYVLSIYNFIVMVFGGTLLGLAIYFYVDNLQYMEVSARMWPIYSTFFIAVIGIGLLTFIVGFFGCCGACKESSCMLCLYFTIIMAICGLIGAVILLPDKFEINSQKIKYNLQHDIREIIQKSYTRHNSASFANMVIDKIQEDFQCCGSSNYTDWRSSVQNNFTRPDIGIGNGAASYIVAESNINQLLSPQPQQQTYYNQAQQPYQQSPVVTTSFRVPTSCCSKRSHETSYTQCKEMIARYDSKEQQRITNINSDGCVDRIYDFLFTANWWALITVGSLAFALQGLSLIFSLCLCCAINRAYDDDEEDDEK